MKTIKKLILSLLLLCQVLLVQLAYADNLKPIDVFKNPNLLADQWLTEPIPLSSYTEEEKRLQRLINDKTATAVQTYSTEAQDSEWTKYDHDEITPYTWKVLELDLTESNGKTFPTSLLRPNWWIRNIGADRKGNRFYLKIPEVVEGWAVVKNIRVNQLDTRLWDEARKGDFVYRPVTATFQHDSHNVQQLYFTGNDTPLEVTPEHPIYSIDRNDFVHAGSLSIGEQVKTRKGITTLEQRKQLAGTHRVYNLEVYRDHNFMVSMDNILVHNNKGKGILWTTWKEYPKKTLNTPNGPQEFAVIGNRYYSQHAVARMQPSGQRYTSGVTEGGKKGSYSGLGHFDGHQNIRGRSISPSNVESIISNSKPIKQTNGNWSYKSGDIKVILSPDKQRVITVISE